MVFLLDAHRTVRKAMPPVIGVPAVVLDDQDMQLILVDAIIDAEGETSHRIAAQVRVDLGPETGRLPDRGDRGFELP